MPNLARLALLVLAAACLAPPAHAGDGDPTRVGAVSTTFRLVGRNDRIAVDRYDDPKVANVSCYISRAETGGVSGSLGLATDPNRFSIACRATGPVSVPADLKKDEVVFGASANWFSKVIRVSRIYDDQKKVLLYLVWSTNELSTGGSAFNSVTAVPIDVK